MDSMKDRTFQIITEQQRTMFAKFAEHQAIPFQAVVGELHEQRSLPQNARLWKLHTLAAEVTGYSAEEMHELALCRHFGFTEVARSNLLSKGVMEIKRVPLKRSSTREKKEFTEFMESTEAWYGTEFGCWLP